MLHEYRLDGQRLPSVTQILRRVLPGWQAAEWYLQRGRALHHACRLLDCGDLDWSSVSPEIEPRIRAWQKFLRDAPAHMLGVEVPVASRAYRFAGTCDRMLVYPGNVLTVADLKSTVEPQVILQLGGYSLLWREAGKGTPARAVAVQLNEDASYRTRWLNAHELRRAEQTFLAALTIFNFMEMNNLKGFQ